MIKNIRYILLVLVWVSCGKDTIDFTGIDDPTYFPLEVGTFRIYDVKQTTYNTGQAETSEFQLREVVVDSFTNQTEGLTYVIHRQLFDQAKQQWQVNEVWSARLENDELVQDEGNIQFVKLKFPLDNGRSWDGNAFNILEEEIYEIDSLGSSYAIDSETSIDNTVTVIQKNDQDIIVETDVRIEKYAKGIGLIYKETKNLEYCTSNDNCLGQQIVEEGLEYIQSIVAFGVE